MPRPVHGARFRFRDALVGVVVGFGLASLVLKHATIDAHASGGGGAAGGDGHHAAAHSLVDAECRDAALNSTGDAAAFPAAASTVISSDSLSAVGAVVSAAGCCCCF